MKKDDTGRLSTLYTPGHKHQKHDNTAHTRLRAVDALCVSDVTTTPFACARFSMQHARSSHKGPQICE